MTTATDASRLRQLPPGSHVCWIVGHPAAYIASAALVLQDAKAAREKPVLFGPAGSAPLVELAHLASTVADPHVEFLGGGPLDADAMFAMFHEQSALARTEGYERLRVVADMDWLLPAAPTTDAIVGFELMLDRHANDLDATIVCAYRRTSFDVEAIGGTLCVHPVEIGSGEAPQFRLVAGSYAMWRLTGEVDIAVASTFEAAITSAAGSAPCVVDVSGLEFIDVGNARAIASASRASETSIRLVGAPRLLRRTWELAGFDEAAPLVELVG